MLFSLALHYFIRRTRKCSNFKASLSLRVKRDEAKKRQHKVLMEKVQPEHIVLTEELDSVVKKHNAMVKTIARERRQADVDKQTLYVNPFYPHPVFKLFELPSCCSHSPYIISFVGQESVVILRQV